MLTVDWIKYQLIHRVFPKNQVMCRRTASSLQLWASGHGSSRWSRPQEQDDFIWSADIISLLCQGCDWGRKLWEELRWFIRLDGCFTFQCHTPFNLFHSFVVEVVKDSTREMSLCQSAAVNRDSDQKVTETVHFSGLCSLKVAFSITFDTQRRKEIKEASFYALPTSFSKATLCPAARRYWSRLKTVSTRKMNRTRLSLRVRKRNKTAVTLNTAYLLLPFLVKKSLEYLPAIMSLRGTLPSSSMISAMWSICGGGHVRGRWGGEKTNDTHKQRVVRREFRHGPGLRERLEGGGFSRQQVRTSLQVSRRKLSRHVSWDSCFHATERCNNLEDIQYFVQQSWI